MYKRQGAVKVNPDDGSKPVRKVGVYAHLELKGGTLSEAQRRLIEMYDEKKKKDEKKKGMEAMDSMTKTSVKDMKTKPDGCEPEEEEKPDLRSKYAMINLIKNKLRAAGQRDPMVMMNDPVMGEENINELKVAPTKVREGEKAAETERTPAKDDPGFDIMRPGGKNSPFNKDGTPKPKVKTKPKDPNIKSKPPHGRRPHKKDTAPNYNPYGTGTANPENMSGSTGP